MVRQSTSWKDLERTAAKKLGGTRIIRGNDFGASDLDVLHPHFAIDAKWRSKLAVLRWWEKLLKDNDRLYGKGNKIPILVMKEKGQRGELLVISLDDFVKIVKEEYLK